MAPDAAAGDGIKSMSVESVRGPDRANGDGASEYVKLPVSERMLASLDLNQKNSFDLSILFATPDILLLRPFIHINLFVHK